MHRGDNDASIHTNPEHQFYCVLGALAEPLILCKFPQAMPPF